MELTLHAGVLAEYYIEVIIGIMERKWKLP